MPSLRQPISMLAFGLVCGLPLALLHARAVAEILIATIDALFLLRAYGDREWRWMGSPFALAAGGWWLWLVFCSAIGTGGLWLALAAVRLPLLAVALGEFVLETERRRRVLWGCIAASALWIGLQCWQQLLTGQNLFGQVRWGDGALTGPFHKPRAGPALALLLFPALLGLRGARAAPALLSLMSLMGLATMLLIGQRMPSALTILGFGLFALLLPRLRAWLIGVLAAGLAVPVLMRAATPAAYDKLVTHTLEQVGDFRHSAYGELFAHALHMLRAHPRLGQGMDGFRRACLHAASDDLGCNLHPHNYYLEQAVDGGVPLLLLFVAMAATGLAAVSPRVAPGVFIALVLAFWPLATTSAFTAIPNAGWIFLLMGLGFAETRGGYSSISRKNWSASSS